ncbi:MAG: hypothetical protein MUC48_26845, partial [Leptolyngbya sp. Prado105]|nr:hypothetical protein [Leptolyngbya sp. Prado105]
DFIGPLAEGILIFEPGQRHEKAQQKRPPERDQLVTINGMNTNRICYDNVSIALTGFDVTALDSPLTE